MKSAVTPTQHPDFREILPGHDFVDAFAVPTRNRQELLSVARVILGTAPRWVDHLMRLRNAIVRPLGLKTDTKDLPSQNDRIGMFPVISATNERVVLGLDDKHLDFRIVLDRTGEAGETLLRLATAVRCRNLFGRLYLKAVLPFHRLIVPAMMRNAEKP